MRTKQYEVYFANLSEESQEEKFSMMMRLSSHIPKLINIYKNETKNKSINYS